MKRARLVPGHTLREQGRPQLEGIFYSGHDAGRALCSCGRESPWLRTNRARQAWFRDHKDDIAAGGDGIVWMKGGPS